MDTNMLKKVDDLALGRTTTVQATNGKTGQTQTISYRDATAVGNGSFGLVYSAILVDSSEMIAIKKVLQDRRFKNRELDIMRLVTHPNVVELKCFFYSKGEKQDDVYLHLVLEYVPETLYRASRQMFKMKLNMPNLQIKLYSYQIFRSLAYIHSKGICHRDIKPQNLLLDPVTGVLKLCDFGSAKVLVPGEPNVAYICSRYYRAPELIFGATNYTTSIDIWSAGCVLAELMSGLPIFPGESSVDQLVEIIKVLGTPTRQQIEAMNPNYTDFKFPNIKAHAWSKVFRSRTGEVLDFIPKLLDYTPTSRITAMEALAHPYYNELRDPETKLANGQPLPPLFNFTAAELSVNPKLNRILIPPHYEPQLRASILDLDSYLRSAPTPMQS